ncbi:polysaccharide deacetylase family protein [Paenibacillus aestuarii]|uniref:Polysaccharide deacetylase family protein n=1 Tax=Paenibacillus aestuarii TaxID=516965 RepID=A0ABW0KHH4_9BACL|nr:polysaccharide deacetylase family protein [Paenibacillus aestuarii]
MSTLLWVLLLLLLVYSILPTILIRLFGIGVYKKGRGGNGIALTFDDGPDPEYTPQLLDLLKKHQVKATFFVLGSKAEQHPELIRRIHLEGHLIGVHNYVHWANAFLPPRKVRAQLNSSIAVIEKITGETPIFYRPPWGIFNLFDFLLMKRFRVVLWSLMVGDWRSSGGKERIIKKLLAKLSSNDIIVLHDSGQTFGADEDAPVHMLEALADFLDICKRRGFTFLRIDTYTQIDELAKRQPASWVKKGLIQVWLRWDRLFHWWFNIRPIDLHHPIFYSRVCKYKGKPLQLDNGEEIRSGDLVLELHFNNERLFHMMAESNSMVQLAVHMIREVQRFLPVLTAYLYMHREVRGVYGVTMIHRGSRQLGFTVEQLPEGLFKKASQLYLRLLLYVFHPNGRERLEASKSQLSPRIVAISVQELMKRYPVEPSMTAAETRSFAVQG